MNISEKKEEMVLSPVSCADDQKNNLVIKKFGNLMNILL